VELDAGDVDNLIYDYVQAPTANLEGDADAALGAACEVLGAQARTFAEAKDIIRRMRVSRGCYPMPRAPIIDLRFLRVALCECKQLCLNLSCRSGCAIICWCARWR